MRNIVFLLTFFSAGMASGSSAQTLFTYGNESVSKAEFLKAYSKNNTTAKPTEKSYRDYLELYIRYKLKVKAAYDLRLDTLPGQITELQNFRNQIVDPYLNDEASVDRLVNEAFARSQKDIHLAQIFIAVPKSATPADTLKFYNKAMAAYTALKKDKDFGKAAAGFSDDPFAKTNFGDLGYITVFTLPYELETLAYSLKPGEVSNLYRSKSGYHIFKNIGERKGIGRIRAAQIMLIFPRNASDAQKQDVKQRADSIYDALMKGSDFADLARQFSGDNLSYQLGGEMPEFGVGRYEKDFETAAFSLTHDGEISRPVASSFGYHIIKRLARKPVSTVKNTETMNALRQQVISDPRIEAAKKEMLQKIIRITHLKKNPVNENELWAYTDSSLQNKTLPRFADLDAKTTLFSFDNKTINVKDWVDYRRSARNNSGPDTKTHRDWLEQLERALAFDYYRNHLENYNADFAYQLNEFKEGNLLFDIMQRKIWDKAAADSAGLQHYYDVHQNDYWWQPGADAIIFSCSSEKAAEDIKHHLQNRIGDWKRAVDSSRGLVQADSGRFELAQLPVKGMESLHAGQFTPSSKNAGDNSVVIAYVLNVYSERSPRSYKDARGFVVNDYQNFLEDQWIAELKQKYPVKVNEAVMKSLPL